jgi:quercetin dioxygenase-like cupin family protein
MVNRRDAIGSLLMMMGAAEGAAAEPSSSSKMWPNTVFTLPEGATTHHPFGDVTVFFQGKTGQLKDMVAGSLVLNPGQEPHPPHQHPEEEIMLITEGRGEILVSGKTTPVSPGALMYCEGNSLHGVKNTGDAPLRFYYFKWLGA